MRPPERRARLALQRHQHRHLAQRAALLRAVVLVRGEGLGGESSSVGLAVHCRDGAICPLAELVSREEALGVTSSRGHGLRV